MVDRVAETRAVAMVGVEATIAVTIAEVEVALVVVVEAILDVVEATMIWAITLISLQILEHKFWPLRWWRPILCQTMKPRWLWLSQQWRWQVLITDRKQSLSGEESQRSNREATGYNRFVNSTKHSGGRA